LSFRKDFLLNLSSWNRERSERYPGSRIRSFLLLDPGSGAGTTKVSKDGLLLTIVIPVPNIVAPDLIRAQKKNVIFHLNNVIPDLIRDPESDPFCFWVLTFAKDMADRASAEPKK